LSEVGSISKLVLKDVRDAFIDQATIAAQWQTLNFTAPPDFSAAVREYEDFAALLDADGIDISYLPRDASVSMDSVYVRDAAVVTPHGVVLAAMGKVLRAREPDAQARFYSTHGVPIVGSIEPPGQLEGGDVVWLDNRTVVIGWGYRTNLAGIRQFEALLSDGVDDCIVAPLPHWRGPADVFHLMSILSPVDRDLAVVYSPLMPVPLREMLIDRGYGFVEVPDEEFASMGANVLATGPRRCVMLEGNPITRAGLERAGAEVRVYRGQEISIKGGGGPTCLTRPLARRSY
jgi:N-dimethylarginine dimethylaminohydrolase